MLVAIEARRIVLILVLGVWPLPAGHNRPLPGGHRADGMTICCHIDNMLLNEVY